MTETDKEFYLAAMEHHPDDAKRFGWMGEQYQKIRFAQIMRLVTLACMRAGRPKDEVTILDFGCGDGELFGLLNHAGIGCEYYGIDMMPEYIELAHERVKKEHWGLDTMLMCYEWDGSEPLPFSEDVDIIVESGTFAAMNPTLRNIMFQQLIRLPRVGFAGTFLMHNINIARVHPSLLPITPAEMISQIDVHQYSYTLLVDYLPHDFALGVYPRPIKRPPPLKK